jgi:hypothetical protein
MTEPTSPPAMTVVVEFMGPVLRPRAQDRVVDLSLAAGATTDDLLTKVGYQPIHAKHVGVFRDGVRLPRATELTDGEHVTIAVAMGGG